MKVFNNTNMCNFEQVVRHDIAMKSIKTRRWEGRKKNSVKKLATYHRLEYCSHMKRGTLKKGQTKTARSLPLLVEKDESNMYVIECPILPGCYSQGKTLDEALRNIQEVISLVCEEKHSRDILKNYLPREISFHTISI